MGKVSAFEFRIPSKTFLVGEYLALDGGPSLIAATGPCFQIGIEDGKRGDISLHPESPAGRLLNEIVPKVTDFLLEDPHEKAGGFGRSTAEFLSLYMYSQYIAGQDSKNLSLKAMVEDYQKLSASEKKSPSGADLVAQYKGGICLYDGKAFSAESYNWPWPSKTFLVFHTGRKLPTHTHLESLEDFSEDRLRTVAMKAIDCYKTQNFAGFSQCVNAYSDELFSMKLADPDVYSIVLKLRQFQTVDVAKGCGAMGVDTVLVVGDKADEEDLLAQGKSLGLEHITGLAELGQGTEMLEQKDVSS